MRNDNIDVLEPVEFYDLASRQQMLLRNWGTPPEPWLFFRHPDGQWVSCHKASQDDLRRIAEATF